MRNRLLLSSVSFTRPFPSSCPAIALPRWLKSWKIRVFYSAFVLFLYIIWNLSLSKFVSVTHIENEKRIRGASLHTHALATCPWDDVMTFSEKCSAGYNSKAHTKKNPLSCLHLATEREVTVTSLWMLNQRHSAWLGMLMQTRCNLAGLHVLLMLCWLACCLYITVYTVYIYKNFQKIVNSL